MRLFLRNLLWLCAFALIGGGFTACSDDETSWTPNPTMSASGEGTSWGTAEFTVLCNDIVEYAWMVLPAEEAAPGEVVIFKDGTVVTSPAAESKIKATGLSVLTDYTLYIAAKSVPTNNDFVEELYGEVVAVPFKTLDYTEEFTLIETNSDGFRAHVQFPASVKEKGSVIKWGVGNLANYRMQGISDAQFLDLNDEYYPAAIIRNDTTLHVCEENRYHMNADGSLWLDPWSEEPVFYWDFIAPGEPLVLIMSEMAWGESLYGWGEGWYVAPYDYYAYEEAQMEAWFGGGEMPDPNDFWYEDAWHQKYFITTTPPEAFNAKVKVETWDLTTKGGVVTLTPDEDVYSYTFTVLDDITYKQVLDQALGGDESLLQWFLTSYYAMWTISTQTCFKGDMDPMVVLEEYFWDLVPGGTYHVIWVAMPSIETEDGPASDPMYQSYEHYTFQLPNYTLDAPEVTVTGLEPTSAYGVRFNVKNTGKDPIVEVAYACNYLREFEAEMQYSTYTDICTMNRGYATFTEEELALVNSPEGYTVEISSRENAISRLAVMAWNSEGRPSNPDSEDGKAVAEATSGVEPAATPIESPYYESLQGSWTATASIATRKYDYNTFDYVWGEGTEMTTTVTIGDVVIPESMTEEAYDIYAQAGHSKESADKYFAELKEETEIFNNKVRGQNRILCQGFQFKSAYALNAADPWKLFTSLDYNATVTGDIFYEFGPKWFLQVAEDGSLFVPVNVNRVAPLTKWADGQEYYLVGGDVSTGYALYVPNQEDMDTPAKWPNIPVEVSEDGNTITLKAFEQDGTTYYPQIVYNSSYYGLTFYSSWQVVSDVVLTRNTVSAAAQSANVAATRAAAAKMVERDAIVAKSANDGAAIELQKAMKSRTAIVSKKAPKTEYKKVEGKALTTKQFKANIEKFRKESRK